VRVIEYSLGDGDDATYFLLSTMLDLKTASATELDELKTHQRSPRVVLRSKMPDGVLQEAYAYFCVHYAIRWLMHSVALAADTDPDRLSFTRTPRVTRRSTASHPGFSPQVLDAAHRQATSELIFEMLPPRRQRSNPRVVKRKMSGYGVKRPEHRDLPRSPDWIPGNFPLK
jgi:hypothetical protein